MRTIAVSLVLLTLSAAQSPKPKPRPVLSVDQSMKSLVLSVDQSMKSLVGRAIYECPSNAKVREEENQIGLESSMPVYFDGVSADGLKVSSKGTLVNYFGAPSVSSSTYIDGPPKLVIREASTSMKPSPPREGDNSVEILLRVEDVVSGMTASFVWHVDKRHISQPDRLFNTDIADSNTFTSRPVGFPHIGVTEHEVYCSIGVPDHTNSDEASGTDQLVYHDSLYIYVRHGRVVNVQDRQ